MCEICIWQTIFSVEIFNAHQFCAYVGTLQEGRATCLGFIVETILRVTVVVGLRILHVNFCFYTAVLGKTKEDWDTKSIQTMVR